MDIKAQRNRFMAFSFAGADLLLEVSPAGTVTFAVGAGGHMIGAGAETLMGKPVEDLFADSDRTLIHHIAKTVTPGRRFGPLGVKIVTGKDETTKDVSLNGCRWPGEKNLFLTISQAAPIGPASTTAKRDGETGLVSKDDFENTASEALESARAAGIDVKLTMIEFGEQDEMLARLNQGERKEFLGRIGAILRGASFADATTEVAKGRYSVMHDAKIDPKNIERDLAEASKDADPNGIGVQINRSTLDIEDDMSNEDAARALVFAVDTFSKTVEGSFNLGSMSGALERMMNETQERIKAFKAAVAEKRLTFVAQPIVDLKTRQTHHHELLVRFKDGESPFETVSFAEKVGIISDLDFAATEFALKFISENKSRPDVGLAVNLSGHSLQNEQFGITLLRLLNKVDFLRNRLLFEVTESSEITDLDIVNRTLQKIRKLGHKVCMDDFGAGAAAFQYLRALEVDYVKLDGVYVRQCLADRKDAMMLKAMAGLCRDLKIKTIAEMIENEDQIKLLTAIGVGQGQGWLFGKPVPVDHIVQLNRPNVA